MTTVRASRERTTRPQPSHDASPRPHQPPAAPHPCSWLPPLLSTLHNHREDQPGGRAAGGPGVVRGQADGKRGASGQATPGGNFPNWGVCSVNAPSAGGSAGGRGRSMPGRVAGSGSESSSGAEPNGLVSNRTSETTVTG